ncbi:MAG: hypothetical protein ABI200_06625 [Gaiellales bacterium]
MRRRSRAGASSSTPLPNVPVVQPVPGTDAARRAEQERAAAAARRPHVLLDPDLASRPTDPAGGLPAGMSAEEIADRIVATLLQGSGPILLCVPGTRGATYETSMLATARSFVKRAGGPVSVASIPYRNGIRDIATRMLHIGTGADDNVLAHVIRKLHAAAPERSILLTGESQGAWLIADTLCADPSLAAAVTRIAMFAKPGFVQVPDTIGSARLGAGILEFRHTDDIVPSLFNRLNLMVLQGWIDTLGEWRRSGSFGYAPHHYDAHAGEAAEFLLRDAAPASDPAHHSSTHPTHPGVE